MAGWDKALTLASGDFLNQEIHQEFYEAIKERMDAVAYTHWASNHGYWLGSLPPAYPLFGKAITDDHNLVNSIVVEFRHDPPDYYTYGRSGFFKLLFGATKPCALLYDYSENFFDVGVWGTIVPGSTTVTINSGSQVNTGTYTIHHFRDTFLLIDNGILIDGINYQAGSGISYTINGHTIAVADAGAQGTFPEMHRTSTGGFLSGGFPTIAMLDDLRAAINRLRYYYVGGGVFNDGWTDFPVFEFKPLPTTKPINWTAPPPASSSRPSAGRVRRRAMRLTGSRSGSARLIVSRSTRACSPRRR